MTEAATKEAPALKRGDFASDQDVRWCPGCGDYTVLFGVHNTLAKLGRPPHENVFISGIGCSSRFPYYMATYGFHTIHGRAATIASGVKSANPDLAVWMITGDGDGMSIGANHLMHAMRRNIDINILLINNKIYGLTKGQYSPCSEQGKVTKTSPLGSIEQPVNPLCFAMAARATFVARTHDGDAKHMQAMLERAAKHKGVSFVEIYQNCKIFNDGIHASINAREVRGERLVYIEHGKPLVFGNTKNKCIKMTGLDPEVVEFDPEAGPPADALIMNEKHDTESLAYALTQMDYPDYPVPMGVLRDVDRPTYDSRLHEQVAEAKEKLGEGDLTKLFRRGAETWVIEAPKAKGETVSGHLESVDANDMEVGEEKESYEQDIEDSLTKAEPSELERILTGSQLKDVKAQADTVFVKRNDNVASVLEKMRGGDHLKTVLVEGDKGAIAGIITERDLLLRLPDGVDIKNVVVAQLMTPNPECLKGTDSIACGLNFMGSRGYRRVPVIHDKAIKVLSADDLLDFIRDA